MKKLSFFILISFIFIGFMSAQTITVTSPHTGDTWCIGSTHNITWTKTGNAGVNVKINIFKDQIDQAHYIPDSQIKCLNSGTKSWQIPNTYATGTYYIRIKGVDSSWNDTGVYGDSGAFMIKITYSTMINPELKGVSIIPKPDLEPRFGALIDKENYHYFEGSIFNRGQVEVKNPRVKLQVSGPGGFKAPTYYTTVQAVIKPNRLALFHSKYFVPNLKERGAFNFIITTDPNDKIKESNETNNRTEFAFEFDPKSDLVVCTSNNKRPRVGYKTQVHAIVRNTGFKNSGSCKLRFYIEKKGSNEYDIPALDPGKIHTITREVKWGLAGTKTISAIIDYYKKVSEYREDNNRVVSSYFVRLPHHKKTTHPPYSICSSKQFNQPW